MSMSDEGTVTDEVRIRELEQALETETDRLRKLYAAYEQQEKERREKEEEMKADLLARDYGRLDIDEKKVTKKELSQKYESYEEAEEDFM